MCNHNYEQKELAVPNTCSDLAQYLIPIRNLSDLIYLCDILIMETHIIKTAFLRFIFVVVTSAISFSISLTLRSKSNSSTLSIVLASYS